MSWQLISTISLDSYILDRFYCTVFREIEQLNLMLFVIKKHLRGTSRIGRDVCELPIQRFLVTIEYLAKLDVSLYLLTFSI